MQLNERHGLSLWQICVCAGAVFILFFCLGWLLFAASPVHAEEVGFSWDANSETDLSGYKLHYGDASGDYTNVVILDKVTSHKMTFVGTPDGRKYYAALTAYSENGESDFSKEVSFVAVEAGPPNPPGGLRFQISGDITSIQAQEVLGILGKSLKGG